MATIVVWWQLSHPIPACLLELGCGTEIAPEKPSSRRVAVDDTDQFVTSLSANSLPPRIILSIGHIREAKQLLKLAFVVTLIISLVIVAAGCVLVYLGATGHTELELFDTKVSTASVGVVGIVCGTVLAILNTRRTLKALERLASLPPDTPMSAKRMEGLSTTN